MQSGEASTSARTARCILEMVLHPPPSWSASRAYLVPLINLFSTIPSPPPPPRPLVSLFPRALLYFDKNDTTPHSPWSQASLSLGDDIYASTSWEIYRAMRILRVPSHRRTESLLLCVCVCKDTWRQCVQQTSLAWPAVCRFWDRPKFSIVFATTCDIPSPLTSSFTLRTSLFPINIRDIPALTEFLHWEKNFLFV